jgi:hypothetical protein
MLFKQQKHFALFLIQATILIIVDRLLEVWYIIIVGFFSTLTDKNFIREVSTIVKALDFVAIPIVQITTSPPIKRYWTNLSSQ